MAMTVIGKASGPGSSAAAGNATHANDVAAAAVSARRAPEPRCVMKDRLSPLARIPQTRSPDLDLAPHVAPHPLPLLVGPRDEPSGPPGREQLALLPEPREDTAADEQRPLDRTSYRLAGQAEVPGRIDLQ